MKTENYYWNLKSGWSFLFFRGLKMAMATRTEIKSSSRIDPETSEMVFVSFIEVYSSNEIIARVNVMNLNEQEKEDEIKRLSTKYENCPLALFAHYQEKNLRFDFFEKRI